MSTRRTLAELLGPDVPAKRGRGRPIAPHRERLVNAQAELAEIRARKLRGELVSAADVEREWTATITDIRQRMLAVPSRLGAKLALSREAVAVIDEEIRAVLTVLSGTGGVSDVGGTRPR